MEREENSLKTVDDLYHLIEERFPVLKKPSLVERHWKRTSWISLLIGLLFFIDFPSSERAKADIVSYNNSKIEIVKLRDSDFKAQLPEGYLTVSGDIGNGSIASPFEFSLYNNGLRYHHGSIRATNHKDEIEIDLLSDPHIRGKSKLVISGFDSYKNTELANTILRSHALKFGTKVIPLIKIIETPEYSGRLQIAIKPRVGTERFRSNFAIFFGLLK